MSDLIKIAYIEQNSNIGGAEVNLFYLFEGMNRDHFYPVVVVPCEGPLTERLKEIGVRYHIIAQVKFISTSTYILGKKIFNPFAVIYDVLVFLPTMWSLRSFLKKERVNIVHTNSMLAHIYGGIAAKISGVPCIWHMQDIIDSKMAFGLAMQSVGFLGGILPKRIISVSNAVEKMFKGKSAQKVQVVYNGTDIEKFSPQTDGTLIRMEFDIAENELVVGMVGRLTEWKGQREFIKASFLVAKEMERVKFMIVGGTTFSSAAYFEELKQLVHELRLSDKVIFTGFRNDIPNLIAAMDICVLPSVLPDPCPLTLFDYMASGKPVVASHLGGPSEIIEHGKDGFLVDPEETENIANIVIELLRDKSLRNKIAESARKKIVEQFSIEKFGSEFQRIYCEVLS
jgi:glycosyltransferase involved in cell wall biosynthesis